VSEESIVLSDGHDSFEFPRVREPWRQILEPLTDRQLAACVRKGVLDHREEGCGKLSGNSLYHSSHVADVAETLAEWRDVPQDDLLIRHELLMWLVSERVSEYGSHVTEEDRRHHPGSKEEYLRGLVQRIQSARPT
jgi:hypothetical protein